MNEFNPVDQFKLGMGEGGFTDVVYEWSLAERRKRAPNRLGPRRSPPSRTPLSPPPLGPPLIERSEPKVFPVRALVRSLVSPLFLLAYRILIPAAPRERALLIFASRRVWP